MYTQENYNEKLDALKKATGAFMVACNKPGATKKSVDSAREAMTKAQDEYNALVRSDAYEKIVTGSDSVLADAAKAYKFGGLKKAVVKTDSKTGLVNSATVEAADDEMYSLRELETAYAKYNDDKQLMAQSEWAANALRARAECAYTEGLKIEADVSRFKAFHSHNPYAYELILAPDGTVKDVSEMTDEEKAALAQPLSITKLIPVLQKMIDSVLFDSSTRTDGKNRYRVVEKDVNWLLLNSLRFDEAKGRNVEVSDKAALVRAFVMLHHLVTGEAYKVCWAGEDAKKR